MKTIAVLGSTGSIGVNTLDVIKDHPSLFKICALAAGRNIELLAQQIERFKPKCVSVIDKKAAGALREMLGPAKDTKILFGTEGYQEIASMQEVRMVVSAIVGAAGLLPTITAIEAGKDIALANKETMVMAGSLVCKKAEAKGVKILPVDSEHSAIFQCLAGQDRKAVRRIILTASGGPFRNFSLEEMIRVTPEETLKHPTWRMGEKITIDSASMMNKGLEVIEAQWLFDVNIDQIDVHIHPQSIIHSMVEYVDGSVIAQLGNPDMRIPIAYALSYPERLHRPGGAVDFFRAGPLEFFEPDDRKFPNLRLAYEAGREGGTLPAALNGANEMAVAAFIERRIRFTDIPEIIREVLNRHVTKEVPSLDDILEADRWAREEAKQYMKEINH
ncbi:MAG: 1-deoxy-D-xylulose-5-phosphate reductoisomerase [Deltaproteobacteria bacterium]|nr:1-deoxy-D-xylulose-5-phosphate reductoisomerase [Deltaproteobacteria bacterium]